MSKVKLACELISGLALATGLGVLALNWSSLPNTVAVHFNALGQPDGFGPKEMILFVAGIAVLLYVTFSIGGHNPQRANVPWEITEANREETMQMVSDLLIAVKAEISIMLSYLLWSMVNCGLQKVDGLGVAFLPVFLVTIFGTIGVFFIRGRKFQKS